MEAHKIGQREFGDGESMWRGWSRGLWTDRVHTHTQVALGTKRTITIMGKGFDGGTATEIKYAREDDNGVKGYIVIFNKQPTVE
ncbi:hypothetical protein HY008_02795 [Candidatus Woesebacteria bacterium]|nr:hypothetical protein [Candidatus Woesebacteria bacterium]